MSIGTRTRRLFTVEEYDRMVEAGILGPDDRLELLGGEIVTMAPIGSRHASSVNLLNELFVPSLIGRAIVQVQGPIRLDDYSEPVPDLSVLRRQDNFYRGALPRVEDIHFLVEVADSTGRRDRREKLPRYAAAGIAEVWMFDLVTGRLHVRRGPHQDEYESVQLLAPGDRVAPIDFPDLVIDVGPILA